MDGVVVEAEADEQAVHAEQILEGTHYRDRAARPHEHGGTAELGRQCFRRPGEIVAVLGHLDGRAAAARLGELDRNPLGQARLDEGAETVADLRRVLGADQAEGDLGGSA
jgi:hypothetical protein